MDQHTLKQLQRTEYEILVALDRYCRENGIRYSLFAGTMLGAVRHGGFIPWDDDIDVAMTRSEYIKFCRLVEKKPIEGYIFENYLNEPTCGICHGKVRKPGTMFLQAGEVESFGHHEIWVDILPLDKERTGIRGLMTRNICRKLVFLTRTNVNLTGDNFQKRIFKRVLRLLPKSFRERLLVKYSDRLAKLDQKISDGYTWGNLCCLDFINGYRLPAESCQDYTEMKFEEGTFMAFADYDRILTHQYGNYMELPPESKRRCGHSPLKIKF